MADFDHRPDNCACGHIADLDGALTRTEDGSEHTPVVCLRVRAA